MKTLENLNGIQLYESTDVLPERFTNNATGKQFPVSVNSLFAIGFFRKTPNAKAEIRRPQVASPFTNIEDILSTATFDVVGSEKLEITDFNGKKVLKDFYHFGNLETLQREQIPTFAQAQPKTETKTGKSKK